jgi:hypothetical protein
MAYSASVLINYDSVVRWVVSAVIVDVFATGELASKQKVASKNQMKVVV